MAELSRWQRCGRCKGSGELKLISPTTKLRLGARDKVRTQKCDSCGGRGKHRV